MTLNKDLILDLFTYDPDNGKLYWKNPRSVRVKEGDEAGSLNKYGHRAVGVLGSNKYAHHIVWFIEKDYWPSAIDHEDHNRDNNRIGNLREVDQQENLKNLSKRKTNTSGTTGVYWYKPYQQWKAQITHKGVFIFGGYFADINDAISKRKELEIELGFHKNHGK